MEVIDTQWMHIIIVFNKNYQLKTDGTSLSCVMSICHLHISDIFTKISRCYGYVAQNEESLTISYF